MKIRCVELREAIHLLVAVGQVLSTTSFGAPPEQPHQIKFDSRNGRGQFGYQAESYVNPTPIKTSISEAEAKQARDLADFVLQQARDTGEFGQVFRLAALRAEIKRLGFEKAHNQMGFVEKFCLNANPGPLDCITSNPIELAKSRGRAAEALSKGRFFSEKAPDGISGADLLVELMGHVPRYGKPGAFLYKEGKKAIERKMFFDQQDEINNLMKRPAPLLMNVDQWSSEVQAEIESLYLDAYRSPSIRTILDQLADPIAGKRHLEASDVDRRRANSHYSLTQTVGEQGREIRSLRTELTRRRYEEWEQGLRSLPDEAAAYWSKESLSRMTSKDIDRIVGDLVEHAEKESRYNLLGKNRDRYSNLSLMGRADPNSKFSLNVDTNIDPTQDSEGGLGPTSISPQTIQKLEGWGRIFDGVGNLSSDKGIRAAAMTAKTAIALIIAKATMTGVPLAGAVVIAVAGLIEGMKALFQSGPTIDEVILMKIERLQDQVEGLIADSSNGFNSLTADGISFKELVRQQFDELKRFGYQSRTEAREAQFHNELMLARLLNQIQALDIGIRKSARQNRSEQNHNRFLGTTSAAWNSSSDFLEEHENALPPPQAVMVGFEANLNAIETSALRGAADSASIGDGIPKLQDGQYSVERDLFEHLASDELDSNLKLISQDLKTFGIDLRPQVPSYVGNLGALAQGLVIDDDGLHLKDPYSLRVFTEEMRRLHGIFSRRPIEGKPLTENHKIWQCSMDPDLKRIRLWLDLAVNQRQALLDVLPKDSEGFNLTPMLAPMFTKYEKEIDLGLKEVVTALESRLLDRNSQLKGYRLGVPASEQPMPKLDDTFFFGTENPSIFACKDYSPKSEANGQSLKLPQLKLGGHAAAIATKWIPKEYIVAKDLLQGSFSFCYDDIDVHNPSVEPWEHGPDSIDRKSIVAHTKGSPGFTIRIRYKTPQGESIDINSIRVTDNDKNVEFFQREYLPTWKNFYPPGVLSGDSTGRLSETIDNPAYKRVLAWAKSQEVYLGEFGGFYPRYTFRDSKDWDNRAAIIESRLANNPDLGKALATYGSPSAPNAIGVESHPSPEEAENRALISFRVRKEISRLAADSLKTHTQSIEQGTGDLVEKLKRLDGARARLLSAVWLALGEQGGTDRELSILQQQLPSSMDVLGQVHIGTDLLNHRAAKAFNQALKAKSRKLYDHLSLRKGNLGGHSKLDSLVKDLVELYFYQARLCPGRRPIKERLPDALQSYFVDNASLQSFLDSDKQLAYALPKPLSNPEFQDVALLDRELTKNHPEFSVEDLERIHSLLRKWDSTKPVIPAASKSTSIQGNPTVERGAGLAEILSELMYSENGPQFDLNAATQHLNRFKDDLPSITEIGLWQKLRALQDKNSRILGAEVEEAINDFSHSSTDRTGRYERVMKSANSTIDYRKNEITRASLKLEGWKKVSEGFDNRFSEIAKNRTRGVTARKERNLGAKSFAVLENVETAVKKMKAHINARVAALSKNVELAESEPADSYRQKSKDLYWDTEFSESFLIYDQNYTFNFTYSFEIEKQLDDALRISTYHARQVEVAVMAAEEAAAKPAQRPGGR